MNQYLPYEADIFEEEDKEEQAKLIRTIFGEAEKKKEIVQNNQYCPICKYETGDTIKLVMNNEGLIYCPNCNYRPIEIGMAPPKEGQHRVISANMRRFDESFVSSIKCSDLARISYAKKRRDKKSKSDNNKLDALHETNLVNPKSLNRL